MCFMNLENSNELPFVWESKSHNDADFLFKIKSTLENYYSLMTSSLCSKS